MAIIDSQAHVYEANTPKAIIKYGCASLKSTNLSQTAVCPLISHFRKILSMGVRQ